MNKIIIALFLLVAKQGFSQVDNNGNPVFNSITTSTDTVSDFTLISNYYTLKNNIDNKGSSVFMSKKPSSPDVINAAISLPSDFFVITKSGEVLNMIMIVNQPTRKYLIINPSTGDREEVACELKGDITENRAMEIVKEKFEKTAAINGDKLQYNNQEFEIISNKEIKDSILSLISSKHLSTSAGASPLRIASPSELRAFILKSSKDGGKLDFFTPIKGKEYDGVQIKPGLFTTNLGVALYKWGKASFDLGVNTEEDALSIFAELKGRDLNQREKDYIKKGFNKELEK